MNENITDQSKSFWKHKSLWEMTQEEWELLCDRCGLCCLLKLRDADTDEVFYTSAACKLLDLDICQCKDYPNRYKKVPSCLNLTPRQVYQYEWLPSTCAYVKISRNQDLDWWHHLISGSMLTVHQAGISLRGRMISEDKINARELFDYVIDGIK
jgi:uncharacterized cysteine cluster protein YcgN (CxxCxxCC family)